jgi:hypothetical protein
MARLVATQTVALALAQETEIPEKTRRWLADIGAGTGSEIFDLPEKSKFLVEWWMINQKALNEGRWREAGVLPSATRYSKGHRDPIQPGLLPTNPSTDTNDVKAKVSPTPQMIEPFEIWADRIIHPDRRDLRFVKLSWRGQSLVEYPPEYLHPQVAPTAHFTTESPVSIDDAANLTMASTESSSSGSFVVLGLMIIAAIGLLCLLLRKRK